MGLVFDESQQMITREGDSPGLPCGDSGSTSSSKSWSNTCSEERLLMLRRRESNYYLNLFRVVRLYKPLFGLIDPLDGLNYYFYLRKFKHFHS